MGYVFVSYEERDRDFARIFGKKRLSDAKLRAF
jgi:hypothetical protein